MLADLHEGTVTAATWQVSSGGCRGHSSRSAGPGPNWAPRG